MADLDLNDGEAAVRDAEWETIRRKEERALARF